MLLMVWLSAFHRQALDKTDFFTFWQRIVLIWVNDFKMNISLFLYLIFCLQAGYLNFIDSVEASKYCFNCSNQPFIVVIWNISSDQTSEQTSLYCHGRNSPILPLDKDIFEIDYLGNLWLIYILTAWYKCVMKYSSLLLHNTSQDSL